MDPVLVHLMRNARSSAVQKQFLKVPEESYTNEHGIKLLVRAADAPASASAALLRSLAAPSSVLCEVIGEPIKQLA